MFEGLSDDKFYGKDKGIPQKTNEYDTATNTYKTIQESYLCRCY